jgi:hypothetical protein
MAEKTTEKTVTKADFRLIKRMSDNTRIYVAEDFNSNFVVVKDDQAEGTFEHQADAYRLYGVLTRAQHEAALHE